MPSRLLAALLCLSCIAPSARAAGATAPAQRAQRGIARPMHLWNSRATAATSTPHLSYHQGRVVASPRYYPVYWGGYWNTQAGQIERDYYDSFLRAVAPDPIFASLVREYSTDDTTLSAGSFGQSAVETKEPGASVSDNDCDDVVETQIDASRLPKPDSSSVYVVFLPPGTQSTQWAGLAGKSCTDYCGYHTAQITTRGNWLLRYIVMPHHDSACPGCMYSAFSNGTPGDLGRHSATVTLSHEMAETQTDPDGQVLSFGWFDNGNLSHGEIGDLCEGTEQVLDGYSVQKMWSNEQSTCAGSGLRAAGGGGGSGGACPSGTHDEAGFCVPDVPAGCGSAGVAPAWSLLGAAALLWRRRRAR